MPRFLVTDCPTSCLSWAARLSATRTPCRIALVALIALRSKDSVYVDHRLNGRGIGGVLLAQLIARCEAGEWRQMVAVIGDSNNAGSIALHERQGFRLVGTLRAVGYKFGHWVDSVLMQRALGDGDGTPPAGPNQHEPSSRTTDGVGRRG